MHTCSYSHLTSQKEWFLRRLPSAKMQQQGHRVKQLWLTATQHRNPGEEKGARVSMSTCHLTFYVETCPFSGCTNKATRHRTACEPQQRRGTKRKSNSVSAPSASSQVNLGSIIQQGWSCHIHPSLLPSQNVMILPPPCSSRALELH